MKQEKNLPCKLTPSELLDRADQLVDCAKKSEEVEWGLERAKKQAKESLEGFKAEARELRQEIATRTTYRLVEVKEELDWEKNIATLYRLDTGEVVERRRGPLQLRSVRPN